jgi:hypothetical protein
VKQVTSEMEAMRAQYQAVITELQVGLTQDGNIHAETCVQHQSTVLRHQYSISAWSGSHFGAPGRSDTQLSSAGSHYQYAVQYPVFNLASVLTTHHTYPVPEGPVPG